MTDVMRVFEGSDGEATKRLYARLQECGAAGVVAMNLFRACKASSRAKVYRGRGWKDRAYGKKNWSLGLLCEALEKDAHGLGIVWGWKVDPEQEFHKWVLYVELPTGQVSFHAEERLAGGDYGGEWDGSRDSAARIVRWTAAVLGKVAAHVENGLA